TRFLDGADSEVDPEPDRVASSRHAVAEAAVRECDVRDQWVPIEREEDRMLVLVEQVLDARRDTPARSREHARLEVPDPERALLVDEGAMRLEVGDQEPLLGIPPHRPPQRPGQLQRPLVAAADSRADAGL